MRETARVFLDAEALTEVRRNTDWAALLAALGIAVDPRRSKADDIWAHSPFAEDRRASFHVTRGRPNSRVTSRHFSQGRASRVLMSSSNRPYGLTCSQISGVSAA
jgi:hypothetical protein